MGGRRTHLEASSFVSKPLASSKRALPEDSTTYEQAVGTGDAEGPRPKGKSEHRRIRRIKERQTGKPCYACRQFGHKAQDCPNTALEGEASVAVAKPTGSICYRCGASDHSLSGCRKRGPLQFATCFICKKTGHLTSTCPENPNGLYPRGGCCKICESKQHLVKDCPQREEVQRGGVVGMVMSADGGADEDDFHEMARAMQKPKKRPAPVESTGAGAPIPVARPATGAPAAKKKKVVAF
ncbi:Zinc finger CCHC domain-containing protein 9 [Saitoella coloradoensis]